MKLHRLTLRNYRGVAHRDVEFPDRGVVVVSGANEIGKSSMIEALDLLVESKDRSTKKEVKQVKPTNVDEGAEITAVMSTGPYRFEYHKRFHKRPETRLTILAPQREQLTGDEAHERVLAILAETVDAELWQAQRVLQSGSTASVDLSGCDALARALDAAAGQAVTTSGSEPLLVDRIDAEYRQYFTATGRAAGPLAAAVARVREARVQVELYQAAVDEVDEAVVTHAALSDDVVRLSQQRVAATTRRRAAAEAAAAVAQLEDRLASARALAEPAEMARVASEAALGERRRLRADLTERTAVIAELDAAVLAAAADEVTAGEAAVAAAAAADVARAEVADAAAHVDVVRRTADRIAHRDEATRLAATLAKVDATAAELAEVEAELALISLTDEVMRDVEMAALATERAAFQAERASARVELDAVAQVEVLIDGQPVQLEPGVGWTQHVTTSATFELPGVMTVRLIPGAPAVDSQDTLDRAREMLAALLEEAGVPDVAAARVVHARRHELSASVGRLRAIGEALLGDDSVADLRARLTDLQDHLAAAGAVDDPGAEVIRAELAAATDAHRLARAHEEAQREAATAATAAAVRATGAATVLRSKLETARTEVASAADRLARQRETQSDDDLVIQVEADAERAKAVVAGVTAIEAELAALGPAAVAAELADAEAAAASLDERHAAVTGDLREVAAQLRVYGTEGRRGRLDAALTEQERAAAEHDGVQRRAAAAQLLHSVMARHRDQSRLRYVEPFRTEVERLGRIVFGVDFEVEIDGDLRILSRTLNGCTVPFDSLSGGAKEQLGIVARLASAALVAKEDGVPVLIDDALGFSDPDRLARMGEVFDAVGGDGQVIVLTCSPERYAGIVDAQHLELSA
ncbi:AAA family ATPase [Mycobacterium yunnanensis]|uniref:AAA family ATPase n=1 Tax=Mycobacterium yunnanensis TaxID=368477 RepID=A0A9X2YYG5_9MYCO|nr:AAA family ATPase [Mycobacterium yunnanensis]MCV7419881.1 AAA family ATPase [Mycobacterium yunnanensis]